MDLAQVLGEEIEGLLPIQNGHQARAVGGYLASLFEYHDEDLDDDPDSPTCGKYLHVFTLKQPA